MAYRASLGELCATFVLVYAACGSGIAVNQRLAGIDTTDDRKFGAQAALSGHCNYDTQHHCTSEGQNMGGRTETSPRMSLLRCAAPLLLQAPSSAA